MTYRLAVSGLRCGRDERALFPPVDFVADDGDIVRIVGDNGAGKSTLLRTLAGLLSPLSGTINWRVDENEPAPPLALIAHENALSQVLSPVENLALLLRLSRQAGRVDEAKIVDTLERLGLDRLAHQPTHTLSAGQKRRVTLARLWLAAPKVWLLDEPVAALDKSARTHTAERIAQLAGAGAVIIYTTHEGMALCDTRCVALD
ncbi:heme ABC exporter ATP-binding protein CcmA [Salinisphaera japonica]|uniref:Transcriptional regulator n=1 Tax=Salinisphaera japonica YTM-1 TaxID=1209778 RepID=A0A423Q2B4_9GAMM|nr:heme ABC exporter ATP-binding protein CcmA [Salinisphaera japonica]ROO32790.1 transcriptional regulator [Salinisphaera japonica YTM-1]